MKTLDRKGLLKKEVCKIEQVQLDEETVVHVREMSGKERDEFENSIVKQVKVGDKMEQRQTLENFRAKLAVATLCDEEGNPLLTIADVETLSKNMTAKTLDKIVEVASRLNKVSEKDKEELTKN